MANHDLVEKRQKSDGGRASGIAGCPMDVMARFPSLTRLRRAFEPQGCVDAIANGRIGGWAAGRGPLEVEAWLDGECVARSTPKIRRDDVASAHPRLHGAGTSGFEIDLPRGPGSDDFLGELTIVARPQRSWSNTTAILASVPVAGAAVSASMANAPDSGVLGPFPMRVIDAIACRWPEDCRDLHSSAGQRRFADRLLKLMATPDLNALPVFADYARYLLATFAHCRFVERHFPATNAGAAADAGDYHCKPNSVSELFAIIHQLYVLKSWGVTGDFAEFGCFKGYSSAMLSFACRLLGLRMHIFDSFEGLPPTLDSGYAGGQFAGSLDEVRDHIARFGAIDAVEFHKGFFSESLREWRPERLMCLWMDVDLAVSASDLMVVADRLDPRATLFSHECTPDVFRRDRIESAPAPDNPIAPMLARHQEMGRALTGRYVAGFTGAFWPRAGGIPAVDIEVLMAMVSTLDRL